LNTIKLCHSWKEFEKKLGNLGSSPKFNKIKGDLFEELTRLYFLSDPTFSTKIINIWNHSNIPQNVIDELGLLQPEIGVDLIAEIKDGTYWAIQCKFHQDRTKNVTYDEVSTFFSITERKQTYNKLSHRIICTSANSISNKVAKAHAEKIGYLTASEFSKLNENHFKVFNKILDGIQIKPKPFEPRAEM